VTRTRITQALILAGLVGGSSCGPRSSEDYPPPTDRAVFVHLVDESARCTPHMGQVPVHVFVGDSVVWDIENDCAGAQAVEFVDFKDKRSGEAKDPFTDGGKKESVDPKNPDKPDANRKQLRAMLKTDESIIGSYKYTVRVAGGGELDPELEVDGKRRR
jgi:hypothetical protein